MTYKADGDPRSHNVLHGSIKDGMLVTDAVPEMHMMADPFLMPQFHWMKAQLKLKMNPDGTLKGILGGYHDWHALYWSYASSGWIEEHSASLDMPGLYYAEKDGRCRSGPEDGRKQIDLDRLGGRGRSGFRDPAG